MSSSSVIKTVRAIAFPNYTSYELAWKYMRALCEHKNAARKAGQASDDYVILLQHKSVYTLGRGGSTEFLKFTGSKEHESPDHEAYRVERGGEVTWHGPGQLVVYPILDLNNFRRDLHWLTRTIEESVIQTLAHYNVQGGRSDVNTGVWVGKNKISAVGISATRWITYHGTSINIDCDMSNFQRIVPCGIVDSAYGVCRLADLISQQTSQNELAADFMTRYLQSFGSVFGVNIVPGSPKEVQDILSHWPAVENSNLQRIFS